ncbi:MAG: Thioredoxin reductase [Candidatus Fermentimicrarchaeum limneticum]|uniref:Thioredoxin reductase n=1 Tax=Fermentimicrarchaeum limneticum TaxID=2795018 RepID=A0A7D5XEG5_FERL1|nr:MAG: Thioredoxin reductase [Candidatus Fermentimicrarchaeum limneticum]
MFDMIVIGGGVSGLSAAMYGGRLGLKTLLLGEMMGGVMNFAHLVENYPGIESTTGMELAEKFKSHASKYSVEFKEERVEGAERTSNGFKVTTGSAAYEAKTLVFATGSEVRKLGVPGEKEFEGKGVHYCALCDGPLYRDRVVAVVGGSDSAAKEALLIAEYATRVYIIYRGEKMRAEEYNLKRVMSNPKIKLITKTSVVGIRGDKLVKSMMLDKEYERKKELKVDAVFIYVGRVPSSQLAAKLGVKLNERGEILTDKNSDTNVLGIFAAGDVTNSSFKQIIVGAGDGVKAAHSAYSYLKNQDIQHVGDV